MIRALRDPDGANLDRVQVIKGWLGSDGKTQERIYDVAVSDGREIGADGRCKTPVGTTVDVADASYTNSHRGRPMLMAHWKDPEFDPKQRAFYYVRVIEIPTPALDGLRRQTLRHQDAQGGHHDRYRTGHTQVRSGTHPEVLK